MLIKLGYVRERVLVPVRLELRTEVRHIFLSENRGLGLVVNMFEGETKVILGLVRHYRILLTF